MALDSTVKVKFLGDAANLAREAARASKATDQVGRSAENAHKHLSNMAKGLLAGVSVGAAAVGLEKFVKSTVGAYKEAAGQASQLSRLTGLAAEDASHLGFAAKETGQDFDAFARSLGILSKNLNGADKAQTVLTKTHHLAIEQVPKLVKGHLEYVSQLKSVTDVSKKTVAGTQSLGFALRDANGHLLPMAELLPKIADKFKNMADGPEKTALALKLFGRGGAALLPFLNKGAEGLKAFSDEADKLGITMSTKDVAGYRAFVANQRSFKAAVEGAKISLGRELFPVFAAWTKALADNGPKLAGYARDLGQKIGPAAQRAADSIKALAKGFQDGTGTGGEIRGVLSGIGTAVKFLVDHAGGLKKAAEAMGLYAIAAKAAAIWSTRLAGANALSGVAGLMGGVARTGPGAAAGIGGVGTALGGLVAPIAEVAGPLAALYGTLKRISDLARGLGGDIGPLLHTSEFGLGNKPDPNKGQSTQQLIDGLSPAEQKQFYEWYPQLKPKAPATIIPRNKPRFDESTGRVVAVVSEAQKAAAATMVAAQTTADANKAALEKGLATAALAQKVADAKAAAAAALQAATDKLRSALQDRLDTAKGIRDSLISSNSVVQQGVSWTAKDLLSRFQTQLDKVKRFSAAISALTHKGFDSTIVQQVAAAGVQGGYGTAIGLARASQAQVLQFNRAQRGIASAAGYAGERTAQTLGPIVNVYIDGKQVAANVITKHDAQLARAVNTWNAQHGGSGHRLAG